MDKKTQKNKIQNFARLVMMGGFFAFLWGGAVYANCTSSWIYTCPDNFHPDSFCKKNTCGNSSLCWLTQDGYYASSCNYRHLELDEQCDMQCVLNTRDCSDFDFYSPVSYFGETFYKNEQRGTAVWHSGGTSLLQTYDVRHSEGCYLHRTGVPNQERHCILGTVHITKPLMQGNASNMYSFKIDYYASGVIATYTCQSCQPGYVLNNGSCQNCPDGYIPVNGTSCQQCPAGTVSDGQHCISCGSNQIAVGGVCQNCQSGFIAHNGVECIPDYNTFYSDVTGTFYLGSNICN